MKIFRSPYHIFLLPLFFIIHNCTIHWLYLELPDFFLLAAKNILVVIVIFSFFYLLMKSSNRAALFTCLLLSVNFFFPEIHSLIRKYSPWSFAGKYVFIIPALLLVIVFLFIKIRKSRHSFSRLTKYLNLLFLLFILLDLTILTFRKFSSSAKKISLINNDLSFSACKECRKPDIYFLVFDEYSSSVSLKEDYSYDNQFLDTFLLQKGFKIQWQSKSNYTSTSFSTASITNMSYLGIADSSVVTSIDYNNAAGLTGNSRLTVFFKNLGYEIVNISIFDINEQKAPIKFLFGKDVSEMIMSRTFLSRMFAEIGWNFFHKKIIRARSKEYAAGIQNILLGIDTIKKVSIEKTNRPKFVYAHLLLPHPPFLMNKTGSKTAEQIGSTPDSSVNGYLDYVYYTNTVIRDLVTTIQTNTNGEAVIIIMGDHGFRRPATKPSPGLHFKIQNAVYFPGKNYTLMYDSISAVNQFRVVLNSIFGQKLPLLHDKQYYLTDRK